MKEKDKRRDVRGESRERAKCQRETLGKYFYDLSKLTFTALVLGNSYVIPIGKDRDKYDWNVHGRDLVLCRVSFLW